MDTLTTPGEGERGLEGVLAASARRSATCLASSPDPFPRRADVSVFCGGAVCVSGPSWKEDRDFAERLARDPAVAGWPLVALVDDARPPRDARSFLWHVFTRFEPGAESTRREPSQEDQVARTAPSSWTRG